jgi:hypothetical protein
MAVMLKVHETCSASGGGKVKRSSATIFTFADVLKWSLNFMNI